MSDEPVEPNSNPEIPAPPKLIVFGLDEKSRPHAAWFSEAEADQGERAAGFMRMKVVSVDTDEQRALALELPQGRVYASGKGFVPFVKAGLYDRLSAFEGAYEPAIPIFANERPATVEVASYYHPTNQDDIAPGGIVLAADYGFAGWYEAFVVEKKADGQLVLHWRDWPDYPDFQRSLFEVGLLPVLKAVADEASPSA